MREVLFRAKGKDDGEWVYGWYCRYQFGKWPLKDAIIPSEEAESGYHRFVEVDPSTVGQSTGLVDKRGSRIFEGDIVRWTWEKHRIIGHQSCHYDGHYFGALLVVRWLPAGYMLCPTNDKDLDIPNAGGKVDNYSFWNYQGGLEIAGNIHDNPELLEEVSDNG